MSSSGDASNFYVGGYRHSLQILTAETTKIWKFRTSPPDSWPVCFTVGVKRYFFEGGEGRGGTSPCVTRSLTLRSWPHARRRRSVMLTASPCTCQFRSFLRKWPTSGHDDVIRQPDVDRISHGACRTISGLCRQLRRYDAVLILLVCLHFATPAKVGSTQRRRSITCSTVWCLWNWMLVPYVWP